MRRWNLRRATRFSAVIGAAWVLAACAGCGGRARLDEDAGPPPNPAAPGFNFAESDERAIDFADQVMLQMGGRDDWDEARYLTWNFFGRRTHVWDKTTGDDRIEFVADDGARYVIILNVNTKDGRVFRDGVELINAAERHEWLRRGYDMFVNDSYWLVMPYKLKDTGVTLTYLGERPLQDGRIADVLRLTFDQVGATPRNKYDVYIARDSGLVEQWSYYREASDTEPSVVAPWADWKWHGGIMLSGDRGPGREIMNIAVLIDVPIGTFTSPEPIDFLTYAAPVVDVDPNR